MIKQLRLLWCDLLWMLQGRPYRETLERLDRKVAQLRKPVRWGEAVKFGPLTVRQVIAELAKYDPDLPVMVDDNPSMLSPSVEVELLHEPARLGGGPACVVIR